MGNSTMRGSRCCTFRVNPFPDQSAGQGRRSSEGFYLFVWDLITLGSHASKSPTPTVIARTDGRDRSEPFTKTR
ncbi:hypothetical protein G7K_6014-t1 [Saitoella complicata NRRL Y-17804]|uniref:Uncharacterized protein n=1 Tax=Saitoella complicata (strain BCRC 22490 / CBS 7301 / JCM 7358 / NBRC 10748 / NRRL Y-17804) TaxID=698492 RepID=A0A0E9NQI2_SAICN|nr:hypothetical protein G7K_6014-t1 [Saitoella complicata NRRL Y-17804]